MNPDEHKLVDLEDHFLTRRQFLQRAGMGFGALSLATLLGEGLFTSTAHAVEAEANLLPKTPPLPAKAKHVVHIFAQGAPSHVDTWDYKPSLAKMDGKEIPGLNGVAMASPFKFFKEGKIRHRSQRSISAHRRTGGRPLRHQVHVYGHPGA